MKNADYRAARGSLAGTSFHELWALSQSMKLLDPTSGISAVAVEGLGQDTGASGDVTEFDGVDCTVLYGNANLAAASRIELIQLKYSGSRPNEKWTLSKLIKNTAEKGNNSVLRRLATMYKATRKVAKASPLVRLISNQTVSNDVVKAFGAFGKGGSPGSEFKSKVANATSLGAKELKAFAKSLDLVSSTGSRFQLEQDLLLEISRWTDEDARTTLDVLLSFIRKQMLPEGLNRFMVREHVLLMIAGSPSLESLFPCPNDIAPPTKPVLRAAARDLAAKLAEGTKQICLHGGAGCGKTTVVQQVAGFLPENSKMIVFDSYGAGRYLDAARLRHRPQDAFVQLCNDVAVAMSLPLFLTKADRVDARSFLRRLGVAAATLRGTHPGALLVIAVDAADNSLTAAKHFGERSFVDDLISIEDLPANVRILVSCRTGRLLDLRLPSFFLAIPLGGFTPEETAEYVKATIPSVPQFWIDDFHALSGGVPRVQRYAIDNGMRLPEGPLSLLRPSGKTLSVIFEEIFAEALRKFGIPDEFAAFCAALVALPRPIPIDYCAKISTFTRQVVMDLCADLAPGLQVEGDSVAFADEDIEDFIRQKAATKLDQMLNGAADVLWGDRDKNDYSASHVATILFATGRKSQLLELIETVGEPSVIIDPMRRREVRLNRIKLGVKLANDHKDLPAALRALLSGAEAVKTDDAISNLINSNLDLAAAFAEESATKRVLLDKERIKLHGSLIAELMLQSALKRQSTAVRSYSRQFRAWLDRRELEASSRQNDPAFDRDRRWDISVRDVAATVEATFLVEGPRSGLQSLLRWTPRVVAVRAANIFVPRLLARGRADLVTPLLEDPSIPSLFKALVAVPLARAGHQVGPETFRQILEDPRLPRLLHMQKMHFGYQREDQYDFADTFACACELSVKRWADQPFFTTVLDRLAASESRQTARLYDHDTDLLNIMVRAYCLSCSIKGREPEVSDFLGPQVEKDSEADEHDRRRAESLRTMIGMLIRFFSVRAKHFLSGDGSETTLKELRDAVRSIRSDEYRISVHSRSRLFELLSLNLFDLSALPDADAAAVLQVAEFVFGEKVSPAGYQLLPLFRRASTNGKTQAIILKWVSERDNAIGALQTTASEKSDAYIALARLTAPISEKDGTVLFAHAHEATGEIDADARFQLRALSALLERSTPSLSAEERKKLACDSASIVTSAAIRIRNEDGFPWHEVTRSIATVHAGTAFAAIAQWEDRSLAESSDILGSALEVFHVPDLSVAGLQVAMNPLIESNRLLRSASETSVGCPLSDELLSDLCRDALQFGFDDDKVEVSRLFENITEPNVWLARLRRTAELIASFQRAKKSDLKNETHEADEPRFDLPSSPFTSAESIAEVIGSARKQGTYVSVSSLLIAIGKTVTPQNRVPHLDALVALPEFNVRGDDVVDALEAAYRDWRGPAVNSWFEEVVPRILRCYLGAFVGLIVWDRENATIDRLVRFLKQTEPSVRALIEGLGKNLDDFDAGTIYELCRRLFGMISSEDAQSVLVPYVGRLKLSIPLEDKAEFDETDIPDSSDAVLARYLFVLMSDVDTRIRWRAAHCLRRLVRYGKCSIVQAIAGLWDRQSEKTFRAPEAPFYWQAARLWLVTALSRIAAENPTSIAPEVNLFLAAIRDEAYPHPAVRSFCQDTLRTLRDNGFISLSDSDQQVLEAANQTGLPRLTRDRRDGFRNQGSGTRRWEFNVIDTTSYWIQPTSRIFAKVSSEGLAIEAERWILDNWKVNPSYGKWNAEPRQSRFSERDYGLRSNDHGSMPTIEDYRTYLEWYSLQCAVGSLMKTEELSKTDYEDGEDEFEERLGRQKLTEHPYWLADLLSTRPPEKRFWNKPGQIDQWLAEISERDFLDEISSGDTGEDLIVFGGADVQSSEFSWDADIESALVEPANALALVRALQTAEEPLDFKLPEAGPERYGSRFSFSETAFTLEGWIRSHDSDGRFDEGDPLCFRVSRTRFMPFEHCERPALAGDGILVWPPTQGITFSYERWRDRRDLTDRDYEGPEIRTFGSRLYAKAEDVFSFLRAHKRDLIMEIRISRKRGGSRHQIRKEEKSIELEGRFCGVFLLREDGSIHNAEGRVGTWPFPGFRSSRAAQ
jgi:energy-coupling factor transporter ATP-binding protein EcfA2